MVTRGVPRGKSALRQHECNSVSVRSGIFFDGHAPRRVPAKPSASRTRRGRIRARRGAFAADRDQNKPQSKPSCGSGSPEGANRVALVPAKDERAGSRGPHCGDTRRFDVASGDQFVCRNGMFELEPRTRMSGPPRRAQSGSSSALAARRDTRPRRCSIVLRGRGIVGGCAEGEALVTCETISGWGGIDPMSGTVIETHHELRGVSFKDKVLVFPGAKGSSGWSNAFHMTRLTGSAPKAMVFNTMTTKIALGAVVMHTPSVTNLDQDPLAVIETGDWVKVDGDRGLVEVRKKR